MATQRDVELLERFLGQTLDTFRLVIELGDIRAREREALGAAIQEFAAVQPRLILGSYQEMPDTDW